jgi:Ran GTPase-activating protein (RanGAP) involved in mRNA processing and transport
MRFRQAPNLRNVALDDAGLGEDMFISFAETLAFLNLTSLSITANKLETVSEGDFRAFVQNLVVANENIVFLNLASNAIVPENLLVLLSGLASCISSSIKDLRLFDCGMGMNGSEMLGAALCSLQSLRTLEIGDMSEHSLAGFARGALSGSFPPLLRLGFSYNHLAHHF